MRVAQIWRYPVKSLGGESLETAEITREGVSGNRTVHIQGGRGLLTGSVRIAHRVSTHRSRRRATSCRSPVGYTCCGASSDRRRRRGRSAST
jgi:uncharacterized protein YcbX